jgi:hypothetical protein
VLANQIGCLLIDIGHIALQRMKTNLKFLIFKIIADCPFHSTLPKKGRKIMHNRLRPIRRCWLRDELRSRLGCLRSATNAR